MKKTGDFLRNRHAEILAGWGGPNTREPIQNILRSGHPAGFSPLHSNEAECGPWLRAAELLDEMEEEIAACDIDADSE